MSNIKTKEPSEAFLRQVDTEFVPRPRKRRVWRPDAEEDAAESEKEVGNASPHPNKILEEDSTSEAVAVGKPDNEKDKATPAKKGRVGGTKAPERRHQKISAQERPSVPTKATAEFVDNKARAKAFIELASRIGSDAMVKYLALWEMRDQDDIICLSKPALAAFFGIQERSAIRLMTDLCTHSCVTVAQDFDPRVARPKSYRINPPILPQPKS